MGIKNYENLLVDEVKDKIAVLLGKTGVGKSSFINCITNKEECKVGKKYNSCTHELKHVDLLRGGYNFYFVDTPGLDDANGDDKIIEVLNNLRQKYPRINALLICVDFYEIRLTKSLETAIKRFMEIFPCTDFWDHVLIIKTKAIRGSRFENMKNDSEGELLNGIIDNKELNMTMKNNNIKIPAKLNEYYVDSFFGNLENETINEFEKICDKIQDFHPIYKEVKEEIKENITTNKINDSEFLYIKTEKHITFIDFDDKSHEIIQQLEEESYNLDGYNPSLILVKREQTNEPHWCYKSQFKTNYILLKFYNIDGKEIKLKIFLTYRYEDKDSDNIQGENKGEDFRLFLENKYKNNCYL